MRRFCKTSKTAIAALIASATVTGAAFAGEQFVDTSGYAVSGYDVVAYRALRPSRDGRLPLAVPGRWDITAEYNGATFAFATQDNRRRFLANPERFVPEYDGHCAMGVAVGGKIPGNPHLWRIVDDKLYLNINGNVYNMWTSDIPGHLEKSAVNWPELESQPASNGGVPGLVTPLQRAPQPTS